MVLELHDMRVMRSLVFVSLLPVLAAGCSRDFNPPPTTGPLPATQSFTAHGVFNADLSTTPIDFVLRVEPVASTMIVGLPGSAASVPIMAVDGNSFVAQATVTLPIPNTACGSQVSLSDFRFTAASDAISGVATGMGELRLGDVAYEKAAHLDFTGVVDVTPPSIVGAEGSIDPLAPFRFDVSEPLLPGAQAQLLSPSEQIVLGSLTGAENATTGFVNQAIALRYDTTYTMMVTPWADLAGNVGGPIKSISTLPAPPLIPGDGFESASASLGGVTIADATTFPPISGQKSALIGGGQPIALGGPPPILPLSPRFTVRLAVAPGSSKVRFSLRQFSFFGSVPGGLFNTQARLVVPGGETASFDLGDVLDSGTDQPLPSGMHVTLGQVHAFEALLPFGVGDEVVFDFVTGVYGSACYGLAPLLPSYQLDDLRVE